MGLLSFLFGPRVGGGDGSSPEKAVIVPSVDAEYAWMARHFRGFQPTEQLLQMIGGKPFDVIALRNDQGDERTVYFDISRFFGR